MTLAPLLADRTVVGMARHETFNNARAKRHCLFILNGKACAIGCGGHAGHDDCARLVICVSVLFDCALPAGAHRTEAGVPAEVRQV